jgi:hypothetical protein
VAGTRKLSGGWAWWKPAWTQLQLRFDLAGRFRAAHAVVLPFEP